jgi:hypothetical protein
MPKMTLTHEDGTVEVRTVFDGQVWAVHDDGSRCPRTGEGRHRQRPRDPRCPGRARYVAKCRACGWSCEGPTHDPVKAKTRLHAGFCDDQRAAAPPGADWREREEERERQRVARWQEETRARKDRERVSRGRPCQHCGAESGRKCRTPAGWKVEMHTARRALVE